MIFAVTIRYTINFASLFGNGLAQDMSLLTMICMLYNAVLSGLGKDLEVESSIDDNDIVSTSYRALAQDGRASRNSDGSYNPKFFLDILLRPQVRCMVCQS